MVLYFTGTGNSRYVARRIAEALHEPLFSINDRVKANDTAPVPTGCQLIVVSPTYGWRLPRVVRDWLLQTEFPKAEQVWFVMTCGSEIGNAARYNRQLARQKKLRYMGTAQIVMPENYIAMFNAPQAEEARQIVTRAEPDVDRAIRCIESGQEFPAPRNNLHERPGKSGLLRAFRQGRAFPGIGAVHWLWPVREALSAEQHHAAKRQARVGRQLHPLHGLHLLLPRRGHRIRQKEPGQAPVSF